MIVIETEVLIITKLLQTTLEKKDREEKEIKVEREPGKI